ncbi:SPOR domain-containing protein [bacterium]|nr:SPOR domain-containing protein [bacterium]
MQEKNELNDIILNKNSSGNGNKKIVLAVATLGIILIIVVMLMNSITSSGTDNLPQAVLPPEPTAQASNETAQEPLFEEVPVVQESAQGNDNLDNIAQKLKQESQEEKATPATKMQAEEPEPAMAEKAEPVKAPVVSKKETAQTTTRAKTSTGGSHYIQVGSFSRYEPNKTFLKSITDKGYKYEFREVKINSQTVNKVLVGPFSDENEARDALKVIRKSVESGAFITKI